LIPSPPDFPLDPFFKSKTMTLERTSDQKVINIQDIENGNYIVSLIVDGKTACSQKVIVQR
jgi:hypothetical protein